MVHFARPGMEHRNCIRSKRLKNKKLQDIMIFAIFLTILRAVRCETIFQRFSGERFNLADRIFRFFKHRNEARRMSRAVDTENKRPAATRDRRGRSVNIFRCGTSVTSRPQPYSRRPSEAGARPLLRADGLRLRQRM